MKNKFVKQIAIGLMAVMLGCASPVGTVVENPMTITAEAATVSPKLSVSKKTIYVGDNFTLKLKNNTKAVKWSTSKKSVATVKGKGSSVVVTAKKAGKATVTAKVGSKKYKCVVTVKAKPVSISAKSKTLTVGDSFELSLKNGGSSAKWSTSKKSVATITKVSSTKYKVTAKKAGTANIKVKYKGKTYTCKVTVKKAEASRLSVKSINAPTYSTMEVTLSGDTKGAVWSIGNTSIAKLEKVSDGKYNVLNLKEGNTTLTVKQGGKTYTCKIEVYSDPRIQYRMLADEKLSSESTLSINESVKLSLANISSTTGNPKWSAKDPSIVELVPEASGACRVYGLRPGTTEVYLTWYGDTFKYKVTVNSTKVQKVYLSESKLVLKSGDTVSLTLNGAEGVMSWTVGCNSTTLDMPLEIQDLNDVIPNGTKTTNNTYVFKVVGKTAPNEYRIFAHYNGDSYSCELIVK